MSRCPVSQAEIDNDQPYERVVNRNYDDEIELCDETAMRKAREFKRLMMDTGEAVNNLNTYDIVDAIEMIKDENLWSVVDGDFTLDQHYHKNKDYIKVIYLSGKLNKFRFQIENEVNSLAQQVFKL